MLPRFALLLLLFLPSFSAAMETIIVSGPESNRVYQRDASNQANIPFSVKGLPAVVDHVRAQLFDADGNEILATDRRVATGGIVEGTISEVPMGGPYRLLIDMLREEETFLRREYTDIFVGDLWILAGQSNMEGSAHLQDLEPPSPFVQVFRLNDQWTRARDPLSDPDLAIDPVHWRTQPESVATADALRVIAGAAGLELTDFVVRKRPISDEARAALSEIGVSMSDFLEVMRPDRGEALQGKSRRTRGAGLGIAFAKRIHSETGVPIGLITNANGGTSMSQWNPELAVHGGESLYGSLIRRVQKVGGKVRGIAWYQGEDEAVSGVGIEEYPDRMRRFVERVRKDLDDPALPFIIVQLGRNFNARVANENWFRIQESQRLLEQEVNHLWMVPAFDQSMSDAIHLDAMGLRNLGRRMGTVALGEVYGKEFMAGPRPAALELLDGQIVRITFDRVNGSLRSTAPFPGFDVFDDRGRRQAIESVSVDEGNGRRLLIHLLHPAANGLRVRYGYGINPVTGILDEVDLPVPAFEWIDVGQRD